MDGVRDVLGRFLLTVLEEHIILMAGLLKSVAVEGTIVLFNVAIEAEALMAVRFR